MNGYILGDIRPSPAPLTAIALQDIIARAHEMKREVAAVPQAYLLELLDRVGRAWSDPSYPCRQEALSRLPDLIGFSPAMIEQGIGVMVDLTRRENMLTRLACDLGDPRSLDDWVFDARFRGFIKAQPIGVVAHVSAGNVFVGGVDTLIQHPAALTHRPVAPDARPNPDVLRISVGLEDPADIIADLDQALRG